MEKGWDGLPYYTIAEHYKKIFGVKTYKIPVALADDCPNRRGLKGMQTCIFCDEWGSAANAEAFEMDLKKQIETYHERIAKKYKAEKFLVYFQAYTNTFLKVQKLKDSFDLALTYPYVSGFTLGTRPDCLSPSVLALWNEYSQKTKIFIELGVQSFKNEDLVFMRRGHTAEDSLRAIQTISTKTSVDLGIHLMFGLPNETKEDIKKTALICNDLPITNVKLHNLHVLKGTPLADLYHAGQFTPIEQQEYFEKVEIFLKHLSPRIAIHRLAAYSSRWEELVAPDWTRDKMGTHQAGIDFLRSRQSYQSDSLAFSFNEEEGADSLNAENLALQKKLSRGSISTSEAHLRSAPRSAPYGQLIKSALID